MWNIPYNFAFIFLSWKYCFLTLKLVYRLSLSLRIHVPTGGELHLTALNVQGRRSANGQFDVKCVVNQHKRAANQNSGIPVCLNQQFTHTHLIACFPECLATGDHVNGSYAIRQRLKHTLSATNISYIHQSLRSQSQSNGWTCCVYVTLKLNCREQIHQYSIILKTVRSGDWFCQLQYWSRNASEVSLLFPVCSVINYFLNW